MKSLFLCLCVLASCVTSESSSVSQSLTSDEAAINERVQPVIDYLRARGVIVEDCRDWRECEPLPGGIEQEVSFEAPAVDEWLSSVDGARIITITTCRIDLWTVRCSVTVVTDADSCKVSCQI